MKHSAQNVPGQMLTGVPRLLEFALVTAADLRPDFGMFAQETMPDKTEFSFLLSINNVTSLEKGSYSSTADMWVDDIRHAVTVDYGETVFSQLMSFLPVQEGMTVRKYIARRCADEELVMLPTAISVNFETRLGAMIQGPFEKYIPFIAKRISRGSMDQPQQAPVIETLVREIVEIGRTDGYLSMVAGGKFNEDRRHIRAREIGEALNEAGGMQTMYAVHQEVMTELGDIPARELEVAWNNIGNWLG